MTFPPEQESAATSVFSALGEGVKKVSAWGKTLGRMFSGGAEGWTCACGTVNKGKFCHECGAKKPADAPLYRCDKCGWEPEDPRHPPKFCPRCGDRFDEGDIVG